MNNKLQFTYFQQFSNQLGCILLFCTHCEFFLVFFTPWTLWDVNSFLLRAMQEPGSAGVSYLSSTAWETQIKKAREISTVELMINESLPECWCFSFILGEVRGGCISFTNKWRNGCTILQAFSIVKDVHKLPINLIFHFRLIGIHKPYLNQNKLGEKWKGKKDFSRIKICLPCM